MTPPAVNRPFLSPTTRIRVWYGLLAIIMAVFVVRLFYLQVIRYNHYHIAALQTQLKQYEIPPARGIIEAHEGDQVVPIVLNEPRYTLFADPKYVKDPAQAAGKIQGNIGGDYSQYINVMKQNSRYAVLAKKLTKEQKDKLDKLNLLGIGTREEDYRTYPQGPLAAQLLGFVNDEGQGKYGLEQYLNKELQGTPGELKAITDAQGVPLAANKDNVLKAPKSGDRVTMTIDIAMQRQAEDILKAGLDAAKSKSGGAIIMDPYTGAIKAMANYPTYNPGEFYKVTDANAFNNNDVSSPLEVGSIMKPLTAAAALNQGVVNANTTYFDPSRFTIGDATVTNIEEDGGPGTRSISDILSLSLNTGATWLLMQMGGGEVNQKARDAWHDYMVNHYQFGKPTGIEQGYEAGGSIPDPDKGFGLNIQYANTAFGQGMTATPLQMGAALSSLVNGGTYYQPHLIDRTTAADGRITTKQPTIIKNGVVSANVSTTLVGFLENVINRNHITYGMPNLRSQFMIGGKTGTAQIAKPTGGYYEDKYNGMFMGFVGGNKAQYVIVVRVDQPGITGYAGSKAAAPIFGNLTNMLIDNFGVLPKS
ncbi:MAG: putative Peptidoglycan glycosyltransferase [Candidatus Saccharibacteria bacterium]|nr:putative Peptidoglycan glycosyltransferase [Candidatus Saccharibacteria bacterium]